MSWFNVFVIEPTSAMITSVEGLGWMEFDMGSIMN